MPRRGLLKKPAGARRGVFVEIDRLPTSADWGYREYLAAKHLSLPIVAALESPQWGNEPFDLIPHIHGPQPGLFTDKGNYKRPGGLRCRNH